MGEAAAPRSDFIVCLVFLMGYTKGTRGHLTVGMLFGLPVPNSAGRSHGIREAFDMERYLGHSPSSWGVETTPRPLKAPFL